MEENLCNSIILQPASTGRARRHILSQEFGHFFTFLFPTRHIAFSYLLGPGTIKLECHNSFKSNDNLQRGADSVCSESTAKIFISQRESV